MLLVVWYCYLRLPCESCPFAAEQRSPTSGQRRRRGTPGMGTGTQSYSGCRPVKSCATAFLLSGTLVSVPAGESSWGAPHPPLNYRALLLSPVRFGNFPPRVLGCQIASLVSRAVAGWWHMACMSKPARQSSLSLSAGVWKGFCV